MAQVVVDPEVPDDARRALESASGEDLIPFSAARDLLSGEMTSVPSGCAA